MLAGLRAHYPEHHNKEKEEEENRKQRTKARHHTPAHTALLPNTNHHRPSAITQPCHKDTTLNQQCRDGEHMEGRKEGGKREEGREWWNNAKGSRTMQGAGSNPNTGITAHTTPAIQQDHPTNKKGRAPTSDREISNTTALPSLCHPPPQHTPHHPQWPHPPPRRGEDGQRIPHHTTSEGRYSPPRTVRDPTRNSTRHDCAVLAVCTESRWHRPHTLDWGRPVAAPPTAIPHGTQPRRMDTIHSSTLTLFTFTQPTINNDQQ